MRTVCLTAFLLTFTICAPCLEIKGELKGDRSWTRSQSPYVILSDFMIPEGKSLAITSGVELRFRPGASLKVLGRLLVRGRPDDPVRFRSDIESAAPGDWKGIIISGGGASQSRIEFAVVEHAEVGITCDRSSPLIVGCLIRMNKVAGLLCLNGSPVIVANRILENGTPESDSASGIIVRGKGSVPSVKYNSISHNFGAGIRFEEEGSSLEWVSFNTIAHNLSNGVELLSGSRIQGLYMCNLIHNYGYDVYLEVPFGLDVTRCFWGGELTAEMKGKGENADISAIFDGHDRRGLGVVRYEGWLDEAVGIEEKAEEDDLLRSSKREKQKREEPAQTFSSDRGYVVYVYPDGKRAMIDYGRRYAVEEGMIFEVMREDKRVGLVRVKEIRDAVSVVEVVETSEGLRRGDRVVLRPVVVLSDESWLGVDRFFERWDEVSMDPVQKRYWSGCVEVPRRRSKLSREAESFMEETGAKCIWEIHCSPQGTVYMRREFELKGKWKRAELEAISPARCDIYINGAKVGTVVPDWRRFKVWSEMRGFEVSRFLQHGRNVIAVSGEPKPKQSGAPVGIILRLTVWPKL
jgi:hypothetical protein